MSAIAYFILQRIIISHHEKEFTLRKAIGKDTKGKISILIYIIGIVLSFYSSWGAIMCYITVAIIWFLPDKRIEMNYPAAS